MDGLKILSEGRKAVNEQRLWEQYLTVYPHMTSENFISFSDFKADVEKPKDKVQTKADIMLSVKNIINLTIER